MTYRFYFTPRPPLSFYDADMEPWQIQRPKIHAVLVCKEDAHAMIELILNLISQGISYVWLVDNASDRPLPYEALEMLEQLGHLNFRVDPRKFVQKRAYRYTSQYARLKGADWIMAVDMDEFPYSTELGTLQNYLTLQDPEVCSIASPFRLFGSYGRSDQPNSLVHGFLGRADSTILKPQASGYKTISRMSCTMWMAVHHAGVFPRYKNMGYNALHGFPNDPSPMLDERAEKQTPDIVTNHYRSQSRRFFLEVKQTRGNAINNGKVRDEKSFLRGNFNHTIDTILLHKVQTRFPSLYLDDRGESLALMPNDDYSNPWPMENIQSALDELQRHQVLAIMNADDALPDTLGLAVRNAAILDATFDCIVRVAPGHVTSVQEYSKLLRFCKAETAIPYTVPYEQYVANTRKKYQDKYDGFVVFEDSRTILQYGTETAGLRRAATAAKKWQDWTEGVERGRVRVIQSGASVKS